MGGLLVVFIITGICIWICWSEGDSLWTGLLGGLVFSAVALMLLAVISIPFKEEIETREEIQYNICGLENKYMSENNAKGAFILGTGGFGSSSKTDLKYYFFKEDENGKKLENISGTDVYIRETDEQEPCYIRKYSICKDTGFFKWIFGDIPYEYLNAKILVVPTNTIKIDYNIDI